MPRRATHSQVLKNALLAALTVAVLLPLAASAAGPYQYFAVTPCRVADTRNPNGINGGPALVGNAVRDFQMRGNCGVPLSAAAVSLNVTITQPNVTTLSWLALFPQGGSFGGISTIDFTAADGALANGAIVPISTNTQDLSILLGSNTGGSVHVILDVTGYFQ